MWTIVEREILEVPRTDRCYYSLHLAPSVFDEAPAASAFRIRVLAGDEHGLGAID